MGDPARAERAQALHRRRFCTLPYPDPHHQFLAVLLVGHADHLRVDDVWMAVEELLDLARIDVLAAADHHVLDPAGDREIAVLVHHRDVAGVHPPVAVDGLRGLLGVVPVAGHHTVAAGAQLPRGAALDLSTRFRDR